MKHLLGVAMGLAAVVVGFGTAQAQMVGQIVGKEAPEIQAQYWLNAPALTLAALRGRVVVVEFWATWCGPCRQSIPHLVELDKQYRPRGVVIIGLTDEPKATVEPFARQMQMTYAVGGGSSSSREYGVRGIPRVFVVDPSGQVVWEGHPMGGLDQAIEEQLKKMPPAAVADETTPAAILDRVGEEIAKENYAAAAEWLDKVPETNRDAGVKRRVEGYRAALAKAAAKSLAQAERHVKDGAWYEASVALETAARIAPRSEAAKRAEARLAELMADEKARPVIEQGREAAAAQTLADLDGRADQMEPGEILKALDDVVSQWPDTKAGRDAAARAEKMRAEEP